MSVRLTLLMIDIMDRRRGIARGEHVICDKGVTLELSEHDETFELREGKNMTRSISLHYGIRDEHRKNERATKPASKQSTRDRPA